MFLRLSPTSIYYSYCLSITLILFSYYLHIFKIFQFFLKFLFCCCCCCFAFQHQDVFLLPPSQILVLQLVLKIILYIFLILVIFILSCVFHFSYYLIHHFLSSSLCLIEYITKKWTSLRKAPHILLFCSFMYGRENVIQYCTF